MPYLPTSQEYLEQSALLLHAYPDTTRITTKYSYPTSKKSSAAQPTSAQSKPSAPGASTTPTQKQTQSQSQTTATLTLKTFHPASGICLKYRTNKAAEIGRLIAGLGKLASGAPDTETAVAAVTGADAAAASSVGMAGDAEMVDASAHAATLGPGNGGGKSKKKTKGKK
ncbi:signal recognition particle 9 kDa protein SRP9 superfamily domain-containing protein [Histoplasma capsulatum]|uniref:Signal recognition particle 9 kDa protein SRP9 superfamily domain-containing protein n=1 Tax=Ajellomyces capsulatus TaxID=5037 RepID=A0A8A1MGB9_AJECA|nr:predicted protein [Histoplasma mississippiense (nom. inval.)]EDN06000.1 predicted protein [Histoplasma mississippiense (nom. inval.)]QSS65536.1 signal recognition particle 9 kDa protein SRP9 superfamily domain-containing protein [Histoplasma capsulatum]